MKLLIILLATGLMAEEPKSKNVETKPVWHGDHAGEDRTVDGVRQTQQLHSQDKLRLREAQLKAQAAAIQFLQAQSTLRDAQSNTASVVAEIEKAAGCKVDMATAECAPKPKEPAKPDAGHGATTQR